MELIGSDVNSLLPDALWYMKTAAHIEDSRNGKVLVAPEPVMLTTLFPDQRVLFCPDRKENPVFHFIECLWMMAGRNDSALLSKYNPRMREFAEENSLLWGAYGYRWRKSFHFDQIESVCRLLKEDPNTRRAVISMWDPALDLLNG